PALPTRRDPAELRSLRPPLGYVRCGLAALHRLRLEERIRGCAGTRRQATAGSNQPSEYSGPASGEAEGAPAGLVDEGDAASGLDGVEIRTEPSCSARQVM